MGERDILYEREKRERKLQPSWKTGRPWLDFQDGIMFCTACKAAGKTASEFVKGCKSTRLESIKKHEKSEVHLHALEAERNEQKEIGTRPSEVVVQKIHRDAFPKLAIMFRTCHAIAKHNRPYTDYVWQCKLDKAKGLQIGETYMNDKQCKIFIKAIADFERDTICKVILSSNFASILCDGSADSAVIDNEIIYLRICQAGVPVTKFLGCMQVEKADADGIVNAMERAANLVGLEWVDLLEQLVGMGSDGASVMLGVRRGVASLLQRENLSITPIHCFGHRLELAYKDAIKKHPVSDKIATFLMGIYYFYHNSPLNRSNLKKSFKALGMKTCIPTRVGGTRWVGHILTALGKILQGYKAITQHLQQLIENGTRERVSGVAQSKARCFMSILNSKDMITFCCFLHDVLSALQIMSKIFQQRNGTAADIHSSLNNVLSVLEKYKNRDGPYLKKLNSGELQFGELKGELIQFPSAKSSLLCKLIEHLSNRFSDANVGVIQATKIVDFKLWPSGNDRDEIEVFGDDYVDVITKHYKTSLLRAGVVVDDISLEWSMLKMDIYSSFPEKVAALSWEKVNRIYNQKYSNILVMVDLLCLPSSSAECERGFSQMKKIKTDVRNCLGEDGLCDIMTIQLESSDIESFEPLPAIHMWNSGGARDKRPFLKDRKPDSEEINIANEVEQPDIASSGRIDMESTEELESDRLSDSSSSDGENGSDSDLETEPEDLLEKLKY